MPRREVRGSGQWELEGIRETDTSPYRSRTIFVLETENDQAVRSDLAGDLAVDVGRALEPVAEEKHGVARGRRGRRAHAGALAQVMARVAHVLEHVRRVPHHHLARIAARRSRAAGRALARVQHAHDARAGHARVQRANRP